MLTTGETSKLRVQSQVGISNDYIYSMGKTSITNQVIAKEQSKETAQKPSAKICIPQLFG